MVCICPRVESIRAVFSMKNDSGVSLWFYCVENIIENVTIPVDGAVDLHSISQMMGRSLHRCTIIVFVR